MIQHLRWNFSNDFTIAVIKSFMALFNCIYLLNVLSLLSVAGESRCQGLSRLCSAEDKLLVPLSSCFSSLSPVREAVLFQDPHWELWGITCLHALFIKRGSNTSAKLFPTTEHWSASLFRDYERRNGEGLPSPPHQALSEFSLREEPTTCGLTDCRSKSLGKGVGERGPECFDLHEKRPRLSTTESLASSQGKAQRLEWWEGRRRVVLKFSW